SNNRFTIRTDKPGVKVSWQVTGVRQDPWAQAHRMEVEPIKPHGARGKYINPDLYGQPDELGEPKSMAAVRLAEARRAAQGREHPELDAAPVEVGPERTVPVAPAPR